MQDIVDFISRHARTRLENLTAKFPTK